MVKGCGPGYIKREDPRSHERVGIMRKMKEKWAGALFFPVTVLACFLVISLGCGEQRSLAANMDPTAAGTDLGPYRKGMVEVIKTNGSTVRFQVEVADHADQRERGMMYRSRLARDQGMWFVFPSEEYRSFWMKNCLIALDMIFVNDRMRIVNIQHMAEPGSTQSQPSKGPARYVLEIRGGEARSKGISAGDQVVFRPLTSSGSR